MQRSKSKSMAKRAAVFAVTAVFALSMMLSADVSAADSSMSSAADSRTSSAAYSTASGSTASGSTSSLSGAAYYQHIIDSESAWIASLQLSNGSLPMTSYRAEAAENGAGSGTSAIRIEENPYFSEFAVLALLESGTKYQTQVKNYLDWHFKHLNTRAEDVSGKTGTIYDYHEYADENGNVIKEKTAVRHGRKFYDSTDSYAALFLADLWKYYSVTKDKEYITAHKGKIDQVVSAMFCTMDRGLTMATPAYHTKYLMDNAEVYKGMTCGMKLYEAAFQNDSRIGRMSRGREMIKSRIGKKMWNRKGQSYYAALTRKGRPYEFKWQRFYMDAAAQLYPVTNGVRSPRAKRSRIVYKKFNRYWSNGKKNHRWERLQTTDPDKYYWGELVYCAALMKDTKRVGIYMRTYMARVKKTDHAYPLYNADSAKVVRAAAVMLGYYK